MELQFDCLLPTVEMGALIDCEIVEDSLFAGLAVFYPGCPKELVLLEEGGRIYKHICKIFLPEQITSAQSTILLSSPEIRKIKFRCELI